MPAGRFLLNHDVLAPDTELTLPDEIAHQVRDVLRLGVGAQVLLLDGAGGEYSVEIIEVSRRIVRTHVSARTDGLPQPVARVTLGLGLLKAARLEWALQKGTELGVAAFQPLLTERAVAATEEFGAAKRRRYERIIAEALEQCGGAWLPELASPRTLTDALASAPSDAIVLIPWEEESAAPLRETLAREAERRTASGDTGATQMYDVRLCIGPEGGFSVDEVRQAREAGALPVTLGPRILRAETAAIVATALALDTLGALRSGPPR
ncbi:MAG TPA: 16S rRNA (uracil(1498)-N(3))-methyltransferase [Ktedonobacterales bacterium]|jgi:16S rRNA (uracil1498-N3)-methyltransferase|nr:16S rRNA (uracil(1498)-N(3))-methyltransferase [Ktedonobacterales bacterium]